MAIACSAAAIAADSAPPEDSAQSRQKPAMPRRAVPALPERMPAPPRPPPSSVPPVAIPPAAAPAPPGPVPLTTCDAGGCWSGGARYNGGTGDTYLDRNGRMCQRNGTWMQCY
jgi:hypothetical protein